MHEIRATVPLNHVAGAMQLAREAGIDRISVSDVYVYGPDAQRQVISVETSTPKARAFIEAFLNSTDLRGAGYSLTSRELRALINGDDLSALTRPMCEPLPDMVQDLWRRQMAARADRGRTFARSQDHFDAPLVGTETGVLIDKTSEVMAAVQDRGQFHGGESSTINRRQTRLTILAKLWAARQNLSPRRVDSDDHRHQSPRRRRYSQVDNRDRDDHR